MMKWDEWSVVVFNWAQVYGLFALGDNRFNRYLCGMNQRGKKEEVKRVDATVIDEQILKKAVKDYLAENKIIPKEPQVNFGKIKVLSLSFLNILRIQYLESLVRLEKLQLDNNIIETIENIGHLTNLKWLDLSFNRIRKIEGLDNLSNLTDISLFNNKISELGGLHNCIKLNIFSAGNNLIISFEEFISYFGRGSEKKTRFKYLQVLNVKGNPFTFKGDKPDKEYEAHLIAHLPNLRYLDYVFIDDKKRKQIRELDDKFKTEDQAKFLQELRIEEQKEQEQEEEKRKKENAKMHLLDGFSEEIVRIDDLDKILKMHGLEEQIQKFTLKVKELVENMQKKIKEENQRKLTEIRKSEAKLVEREKQAEQKSASAILQFQREKKKFEKIFESRQGNWRAQATQLRKRIDTLKDSLLNIEVQLMEDAQALFKKQIVMGTEEYSKKILTILNEEQKDEKNDQTGFFKKIEDEIKEFGVQLERISREEIERYTNLQNSGDNQSQFSSDPELNSILQNKETIPGTVSTIKELLIEKKSKKESEIEHQLITKDKQAYKKHYDQRQYERNRNNVRNINDKIEELTKELTRLTVYEQEDD